MYKVPKVNINILNLQLYPLSCSCLLVYEANDVVILNE